MSNHHDVHTGLITLLPQSVNFILLVSFLIWKCKKPIQEHFSQLAIKTKEIHEKAKLDFEQAQSLLEQRTNAQKNIATIKQKLEAENEAHFQEFTRKSKLENDQKITKLKAEMTQRLESTKSTKLKSLHGALVSAIIMQVQSKVRQNDSVRTKLTVNLLKDFTV